MKRIGLLSAVLLVAALVIATPVSAQEFGIKGGITSSDITGRPGAQFQVEFTSKVAAVGGISYSTPLNRRMSLQLEALYLRRDVDSVSVGSRQFGFLRVTYIEVPVLAVIDLSSGTTRPTLQTGPEVGFRVSESGQFEVGDGVGINDLEQELKSTTFGWVVGMGLITPAGTGNFTLDARYMFGITDVFKADVRAGRKWGNFVIMAGYVF